MKGDVLTFTLFHMADILRVDLPGVNILLPRILPALEAVLTTSTYNFRYYRKVIYQFDFLTVAVLTELGIGLHTRSCVLSLMKLESGTTPFLCYFQISIVKRQSTFSLHVVCMVVSDLLVILQHT